MSRRIVRTSIFILAALSAVILILGAAFLWRLSRGPVALDFLVPRIETQVNAALKGISAQIGGVLFEFDSKTNVPHLRLKDLVLRDKHGGLIAKSDRAALGFTTGDLLFGTIKPQSLELIGSHLLVRRELNGAVRLGFADVTNKGDLSPEVEASPNLSEKSDREVQPEPKFSIGSSQPIIDILSGTDASASTALLTDIRITQASLEFHDEINQANWYAPNIDLSFKRMSYGFVVFAKASVASDPTEWQTEVSATYRNENHSFSISARIFDLIPSNVAHKIYGLAKFAQVKIPLSGHSEIELSGDGVVTKANFDLSSAAGVVDFPDYFANPLVVDEGSLKVNYDVAQGRFNIVDSTLLVGGSSAELTGSLDPLRDVEGKLTGFGLEIKAKNVALDTQGTVHDAVLVDRVEFKGHTSVGEASLAIEDLLIMSGDSGLRMNGTVSGGERSPAIAMRGNLHGISVDFLKRLWPPVIGPKSRAWVQENVTAGTITEGDFTINIAAEQLAQAKETKSLPDDVLDFRFTLRDVVSRYFKNLPPVKGGGGTGHLRGNSFDLLLDRGTVTTARGGELQIFNTSFHASHLLSPPVDANFEINVAGSIPDMVSVLWEPDLNLFKTANSFLARATGQGSARIAISTPLMANVPKDQVHIESTVEVSKGAMQALAPGINVTDADVTITSNHDGMVLKGPAKINGFAANVLWSKAAAPNSAPSLSMTAVLTESDQKRLGLDAAGMVNGPVSLSADFTNPGASNMKVDVEADLSKAEMQLSTLYWYRAPTPGTKLSFTYSKGEGQSAAIRDVKLQGQGLALTGDVTLGPGFQMQSAQFSEVMLNEDNVFALKISHQQNGFLNYAITGQSFDARPFIESTFSNSGGVRTAASRANIDITAKMERVVVSRGEDVMGVDAQIAIRQGTVSTANIGGQYKSGQPLRISVTNGADGRRAEVDSGDAGATLRAFNIYSKVFGGELGFNADLTGLGSNIRRGKLKISDFAVRGEPALSAIDGQNKQGKNGPRRDGLTFRKLTLYFATNDKLITIEDVKVRGAEIGAVAKGLIRKADGALDITGTISPMYEINAALGKIPIVGTLLTGGEGRGIFGLTFALGGTFAKPKFQVNPLSAVAPGIFRGIFEYDGPDGVGPPQRKSGPKSK